jgi:hypothetical protein
MLMEEKLWPSARNAEEKLHRQENHGRWLVAQTGTVRELNSQ